MKAIDILKTYFSVPSHPVTNSELMNLKKTDPDGFNELVNGAAKELGVERD